MSKAKSTALVPVVDLPLALPVAANGPSSLGVAAPDEGSSLIASAQAAAQVAGAAAQTAAGYVYDKATSLVGMVTGGEPAKPEEQATDPEPAPEPAPAPAPEPAKPDAKPTRPRRSRLFT
jgi:hypothetical protein